MRHEELRQKALNKESVKEEFNCLKPEYELVHRMLVAREKAGMTQADVAERMGTKTPAVARLERSLITGIHSTSISSLRKYAEAVNCRIDIKLTSVK